MPFVEGPEEIPEKIKDIGVDIGVAARFTSNSQRFSQWIETPKSNHAHAQVHRWTPQLPWMDSATTMVQPLDFHGSAARLAWFSFCASIHQLLNLKTAVGDEVFSRRAAERLRMRREMRI